ncbi:MAG: hypothetical protein ABW061_06730 [Polyangiaceae bacterium]
MRKDFECGAAAWVWLVALLAVSVGCGEQPTEYVTQVHQRLAEKVSSPFDLERYPTDFNTAYPEKIVADCGTKRCVVAHHLSFSDGSGWALATRVDASGTVVDTPRIQVAAGQWPVRVIAREDEFLLITSSTASADVAPFHFYLLQGESGTVSAVPGQDLPTTIPVHAAGGPNGWIMYSRHGQASDMSAQVYDTAFRPLGTPVTFPASLADIQDPVVGPDQYLVGDYGTVIRMDAKTGAALDDPPILLSKYLSGGMRGVFADDIYQLVWGSRYGVVGARLRASTGQILDPDDDFNQTPGPKTLRSHVSAASGNIDIDRLAGDVVVSFAMVDHSLQAMRVNPQTGMPDNPNPVTIQILQYNSGSASVHELHALNDIVLVEDSLRYLDIGQRQNAPNIARFPNPSLTLAVPAYDRFSCRTAASSAGFLAVYAIGSSSYRQGSKIVATRINPDTGAYLDDPPIAIGTGEYPAVASNGSDYFVAWLSTADGNTTAHWRVVQANGKLGTAQSAPLYTGVDDVAPAITFNGDYYLATFGSRAARFQPDGQLVFPSTPLPNNSAIYDTGFYFTLGGASPQVAADTTPNADRKTFLLVGETGSDTARSVSARRLRSQTGALLDTTTIAAGNRQPFTASDGTDLLVVSLEPTSGAWYGVFVDPVSGTPRADTKKVLLASVGSVNAVFYDGTHYDIIANDNSTFPWHARLHRFDSTLTRVSDDDPAGTLLSADRQSLYDTDAAARGQRGLFVFQTSDVPRFGVDIKGVLFAADGSDPSTIGSGGTNGSAGTSGTGGATNDAAGAPSAAGDNTGATTSAGGKANGANGGAKASGGDSNPDPGGTTSTAGGSNVAGNTGNAVGGSTSGGSSAASAGDGTDSTISHKDTGCGCRMASAPAGGEWLVGLGVALALASRRRKRA